MKLIVFHLSERWRESLFVVPMLFVVVGIVLGQLGIALDREIGTGASTLPLGLTSTVASARAVLSTVAGATITVAGIAFSVSLLTIQLASSQYSPRVVSGLFRDPFNKRVIGVVVGTFAYCLVVLRSVRTAIEQQGDAVVPNASVAFAVLLGIASILAIIAFINHNAHAMDISQILDGVTRDSIKAVRRNSSADTLQPAETPRPDTVPRGDGLQVRSDRDGWVQLLDEEQLIEVVPEGGTVRLDTAVGRYVMQGAPLCTLWPVPPEADDSVDRARASVQVGETRTLRQDASYGLRQLVDVSLKALSPGVNDPTTAQDAIFHVAAVLGALLACDPPMRDFRHGARRLVRAQEPDHDDYVALAYDEIRLAAARHPAVAIYLLESMALLERSLEPPPDPEISTLLHRHARLVMEAVQRAELAPHDVDRVRRIYERHFDG